MENKRERIAAVKGFLKERLTAYRDGEREIENQAEMIERLKIKLEGVGATEITDTPRSPSPPNDRISDLLSQKLEAEAEIVETINRRRMERLYIEELLSHVKRADERGVIRFRYLIGMEWVDVANALFGGKRDYLRKESSYIRRTTRLHGQALFNMASYAVEREETPAQMS